MNTSNPIKAARPGLVTKLIKLTGVGTLCVCLAGLIFSALESGTPKAGAAATLLTDSRNAVVGDWQFSSVAIVPNVYWTSNAFVCWDLTGTNGLRVNATNAQLEWLMGGTNAQAVLSTNIFINMTNSGSGTVPRMLQFRNGLLVSIGTS